MRWGWVALLVVGCSRQVDLPLELDPALGAVGLITERSGVRTIVTQPLTTPFPALNVGDDESLRLQLLVWAETPEALGELRMAPPEGDPPPLPVAAYEADLERGLWRQIAGVEVVVQSVVRVRPDPCAGVRVSQERVPIRSDTFGVRGLLPVAPDRVLLVFQRAMFAVTSTSIAPLAPPIADMRAAAQAPDGTVWITTSTGTWRGRWTGAELAMSRVAEYEGRSPYSLAADDDELLELSRDGGLRRFVGGAWTTVHQFDTGAELHARGSVVRVGPGEFAAGVATDGVFVRWQRGEARPTSLDEGAEGGMGFARFGELGLVVGTSLGNVVSEATRYRAFEDRRGAIPAGIDLRVLAPFGEDLLIAGDLGWVGLLTLERELCRAPEHGEATFRLAAPLGDGLLIAGQSLMSSMNDVVISRVSRAR